MVDKLFRLIDKDNDGVVLPEEILQWLSDITNLRFSFEISELNFVSCLKIKLIFQKKIRIR